MKAHMTRTKSVAMALATMMAMTATLTMPQKANAFILGLMITTPGATDGLKDMTGVQKVAIGAGAIAAITFAVVVSGAVGTVFLLDNPSDAVGAFSRKLATQYGASQTEAKELAILFINTQNRELRSGQQLEISSDQVTAAAPVFSKTAGYTQLINDLRAAQNTIDQK